jgi:hypothetical protein
MKVDSGSAPSSAIRKSRFERFEPNLQVSEHCAIHSLADKGLQIVQQVVLPRLTEGQTIDREAAFEPGEPRDFPAKRG